LRALALEGFHFTAKFLGMATVKGNTAIRRRVPILDFQRVGLGSPTPRETTQTLVKNWWRRGDKAVEGMEVIDSRWL
jgi:hypothetical protein